MEIADSLLLTQPLSNNMWTWTLSSRLGNLIERTEQEFGPRDTTYTLLGIEFCDQTPYIWYRGNKQVIIRLNSGCAKDEVQACYQLAHECIHLLAPTAGSHATVLEEGVAVVFSGKYIWESFHVPFHPTNPKYNEPAQLVEKLFAIDADAVRKVRAIHPSFHGMPASDLLQVCPACPPDLADRLLGPF